MFKDGDFAIEEEEQKGSVNAFKEAKANLEDSKSTPKKTTKKASASISKTPQKKDSTP